MSTHRVLPATQTAATLDPHHLVIEIGTFSRGRIEASVAGTMDAKPGQLVAHEMCHWFDLVGSLWGQEYIDTLFAAYDAVLTAPLPATESYPAVLKTFDADRRVLFPSYYKFVKANSKPDLGPGKWRMSITSGLEFAADGTPDSLRPHLFVRFFDKDKMEIARQPLSVGSLLEMRAIDAEAGAGADLLKLMPKDLGQREQERFAAESLALFYNPEMTIYSAGLHMMSYAFPLLEAVHLGAIGSIFADLMLNLSPTYFQRVKVPADLMSPRQRNFLNANDRGFVFACLAFWLKHLKPKDLEAEEFIPAALSKAGLPAPRDIYLKAIQLVQRNRSGSLRNAELSRIRHTLQQAGVEIITRKMERESRLRFTDWPELPTPIIMDMEAEEFALGRLALPLKDVEFLYDCYLKVEAATRQALRASRGLDFQFTDFVY